MILAFVGIAVSLLLGYFITALLWPPAIPRGLAIAFAPAVGFGLCSIIFIAFRRPVFIVEIGLLLICAAAWFIFKKPVLWSPLLEKWRPPAIYLVLACGLGMALSFWMIRIDRSPYGDWDATGIWNSHARYLYRDGPSWSKTIRNTFHADYPLLVPATAARLWRYIGHEVPETAGMLGVLYGLASLVVLTSTLAFFRSDVRTVLFGLTLLGTPFYLDYATSGSADVPLSLYILSTIALICLEASVTPGNAGPMVLAGFTAGCAGWTKNEGLLIICATSLALLIPMLWDPRSTIRRFSAFLAGIALPFAAILWFKFVVAPPNDIFGSRQFAEMVGKLTNPQRYWTVLLGASDGFWSFGDWILNPILLLLGYVVLYRLDRRVLTNRGWLQGVLTCATVLAGYGFVYVMTPMDLQWHLDSSLPRLYLHLWPAFLLLAGMIAAENKQTEGNDGLARSSFAKVSAEAP